MSDFSIMIQMILVVFLIISAIGVSVTKNLFMAVIVFMGYSSIMAIVLLAAMITFAIFSGKLELFKNKKIG